MQELEGLGLLASAAQPEPRPVSAEDLSKMPFLDAIVHESLRLMAPAPNGGFRLLEKDTKVRHMHGLHAWPVSSASAVPRRRRPYAGSEFHAT